MLLKFMVRLIDQRKMKINEFFELLMVSIWSQSNVTTKFTHAYTRGDLKSNINV